MLCISLSTQKNRLLFSPAPQFFPFSACHLQRATFNIRCQKKEKKRSREGPEVRRMLGFWAWDTTIALSKHMLSHLPCSNIKPETRRGGPGKWWGKIRGRKTQGKLGGKKEKKNAETGIASSCRCNKKLHTKLSGLCCM